MVFGKAIMTYLEAKMDLNHRSYRKQSKEKMGRCLDQSVPLDSVESFATTVQLEHTRTTILLENACLVKTNQLMLSILE